MARSGPHRDRRKVCLLNLLAKLATVPEGDPLNQHVDSIFFSEMDRIYVRAEHGFHESIQGSGVLDTDSVIHPTHHKLKTKLPGEPEHFDLTSYRQDVRQSMQVVVAQHKGDHPWVYADIDIDHRNPGYDLLGAFIHLGQLLDPDKTNHFDFSDDLRDSPAGKFLYYNAKTAPHPHTSAAHPLTATSAFDPSVAPKKVSDIPWNIRWKPISSPVVWKLDSGHSETMAPARSPPPEATTPGFPSAANLRPLQPPRPWGT